MVNDIELRYEHKLASLTPVQRLGLEILEAKSGGHVYQEVALALLNALPTRNITLPVMTLAARYSQMAGYSDAIIPDSRGLFDQPELKPETVLGIVRREFIRYTAFEPRTSQEDILSPFVLAHVSGRPGLARMSIGSEYGLPHFFWEEYLTRSVKVESQRPKVKEAARSAWENIEASRIVVPVWEEPKTHQPCDYVLDASVVRALIGKIRHKNVLGNSGVAEAKRVFAAAKGERQTVSM